MICFSKELVSFWRLSACSAWLRWTLFIPGIECGCGTNRLRFFGLLFSKIGHDRHRLNGTLLDFDLVALPKFLHGISSLWVVISFDAGLVTSLEKIMVGLGIISFREFCDATFIVLTP